MKVKVIKKQWSYSDELSTECDKQLAILKAKGATEVKSELVYTDTFVGVAFTWKEPAHAEPKAEVVVDAEANAPAEKPAKKK